MSKANDKLSKLANFGALAGAKPAASAHAAVAASNEEHPDATEVASDVAVEVGPDAAPAKPAVKTRAGPVAKQKPLPKVERKPLVRNVIFTNEDQIELERLEGLMRGAGITRPSIADIVRVALRAAAPSAEGVLEVFRVTKLLDGRTFEGKRLKRGM